jgi:hypothetical protein
MVAYDNKAYVFAGQGGSAADGTLAHCEMYDPITAVWTRISDYPHQKARSSMAVLAIPSFGILLCGKLVSVCISRACVTTYHITLLLIAYRW